MAEVINLAEFASRRDVSANTSLAPALRDSTGQQSETDNKELLTADILAKLDDEGEYSKFATLARSAADRLAFCIQSITSDRLTADDAFISCKPIFAELLVHRDLSDSVGIVALKCFQATLSVKAVVDVPELPLALMEALREISKAPYMKFADACTLVDRIESRAKLAPLPGFRELANELIENAEVSHA